MKKMFRKKTEQSSARKKALFLFLLCSVSAISFSQKTITGTVTSDDDEGLVGVQVSVKNSSLGTLTDSSGAYKISGNNVTEQSTLVFSYLGMKTQERKIGDRSVINVKMREETHGLDEVVVIGYGTMRKSDLTGSVGNVRMDDLKKAPVFTFDQALSGRVAGVTVSSNDGQPGAAMDIVIRGGNSLTQSNAPLYVIDGFPMEDDMNIDINPADIESINILKDASASAIYGARAANGVIVIETKKGQLGKPTVSFNTSFGTQNILKTMDMMSPYEFVKYQLELNNADATQRYLSDGKTLDSYAGLKGYDWQSQVFRTAPVQNYSVAIRGGREEIKYSVSASYSDQNGIILNSGFKRYNAKAALDIRLRKDIRTGFNTILSRNTNYGQIPSSTNVGGLASSSLMYSVWGYRPVTGKEDYSDLENELIDPDIDSSSDYRVNPVLNLKNELRENRMNNVKVDAYLVYDITKEFRLKITGGVNARIARQDVFYNSNTTRGTAQIPSNSARLTNGSVVYTEGDVWMNENTLTYSKKIRKYHAITALAGASFQERKTSKYGLSAFMVPNETLGLSGLDEGTPSSVTAYDSNSRMMSFFSRVNYHYKSRYMLTGTVRADASSKFAKGNRWGYFPSAAFAWRLSEESFMDNFEFLSNAKIRLSYGLTGNNRVSDFAYLSSLSLPLDVSYSFNNSTPMKGVTPTEMGNKNLTWETTAQSDIGIDLGLFDNRVDITLDLYRKVTSNLLLYADLSYMTGFPNVYNNIGKIKNEGLEVTLNTVNVESRNFRWESSFNISFNNNKILELVSDDMLSNISWDNAFNNTPLYIAEVGGPAARFYGYVFDGVYQYSDFDFVDGKYILKDHMPTNGNVRGNIQPGDIKYKDLVGDDLVVNADDRTVIGNPFPIHTGGFNNRFTCKNLTLGVFFQWSYGNDVYNANRLVFEGNSLSRLGLNQFTTYQDRWTPENQSNEYFRTNGFGPKGVYSSHVIEDGSYLRLKTISLAYNFPNKIEKILSLNELSVNLSVQNLFTWTKYSGMDPEVSVRNTILTPGFDYSAYPHARTIMFGLNVTL